MSRSLLFLSFLMLFTACARHRMMQRVQQYNIRTIAIMPAQLEVVGNLPRNMLPEAFQQQVEQNRRFIEQSLYTALVQFVDRRRRNLSNVQFQSLDRTRNLLAQLNFSDSIIWQKDPAEIARLLGVDAVVKARVTQNRILSDGLAAGVDVVGGIINRNIPQANLPVSGTRTSDIFFNCELLKEGISLWSRQIRNATDWNYPLQMAIQHVTGRIARDFPL